jgi:hypothetical protein
MKKLALTLFALVALWGCTSEAPQPAAKPQPTELLTGREAFQQLFVAARGWAGDIRPYQLQSGVIGENRAMMAKRPFGALHLHRYR